MNVLGLDIGGANLKASDGRAWAKSVAFPLWREPNRLAAVLEELIAASPECERLAVTMTGELCDCFSNKAEGVRHILAATQQAAKGPDVVVYLVDGRFVSVGEAAEMPELAAASNWHLLARFAARFVDGEAALLLDVGSTTTDIIPIVDGGVAARGLNDTQRLTSGELVYSGVGRTPICAVVQSVPWKSGECPVAAELFATTADAYLVLGDVAPDPAALWTADGRPLVREFSLQRLARAVCADADDLEPGDAERIAAAVKNSQLKSIAGSIICVTNSMSRRPSKCIVSGSGEFLAREAATQSLPGIEFVSLAEKLGPAAGQCAPSHAAAVLAKTV